MKRLIGLAAVMLFILIRIAVAEEAVTGSLTTGETAAGAVQTPIAVVLSNEESARPLMNLSCADVVFEMELTRDGHTGYLAVYNDDIPQEVACPAAAAIMHVDIAQSFGACLVHVGGQTTEGTNVNDYIAASGYRGIRFDGLRDTGYFFRDTEKALPDNSVCRLSLLAQRVDAASLSPRASMTFSADEYTSAGKSNSVFRIRYNKEAGFYPSYQYNPDQGVYERFYNRARQEDANGSGYACSNVIVMRVDYTWYQDDPGRPIAALTGSNKCDYFIGGKHFTGTWARGEASASTVFYDENGSIVLFRPGKTFVQIIRSDDQLEIVR